MAQVHEHETVERRAELQVQTKKGALSFRLPEGSTFLGRSDDAQIKLTDEVLEAKHLEFDWDGDELWLIHLGKGARPIVNGELVSEKRLYSGDQVEVGEVDLRVRILRRLVPQPATAAPSPGQKAGELAEAGVSEAPPGETQEGAVPPEEQVLLEFKAHQLVQQPRKGAIVSIALIAFFILMWFFIIPGNPFMLMLSLAIILGSVSAFVFPLRYRLTEAGVEIRGVLIRDFKRWERFERFTVYPDAVQLFVSQRSLRGRLVKGTLIYYRNNRDEVLSIIRRKVTPAGQQS